MSSNEPIRKYDSNGKIIHCKYSTGLEQWWEYDSNGNCIHYRDSNGHETWREYDSNDNCIHFKASDGFEVWYWDGEETEDPVKILLLATQLYSEVSQ